MKNLVIIALLSCNVAYLVASSEYNQAHEKLSAYFYAEQEQEKRVKAARIMALVDAVSKLRINISRKDLKAVRTNLEKALLKNEANEPIIQVLSDITQTHKRKFPCCCTPWIWQATLNDEALALRKSIDNVLKKENPDIFTVAQNSASVTPTIAYAVQTGASAPTLQTPLLYIGQNSGKR